MCDGKNHNLIRIISTSYMNGIDHVVRWCQDCGAVVVDTDVDGRTLPGAFMKMQFPSTAYKKK